eukprot:2463208-Pyramimonas_sp.AAC.1
MNSSPLAFFRQANKRPPIEKETLCTKKSTGRDGNGREGGGEKGEKGQTRPAPTRDEPEEGGRRTADATKAKPSTGRLPRGPGSTETTEACIENRGQ